VPAAPKAGFRAPDFQLRTVDGDTVALSDFGGKVVLLNFWASWCMPCRLEMPAFQKVHQVYQEDGLVVLGVNSSSDYLEDAIKFIEDEQLTFKVVRDEDNRVAGLYGVRALPTTFLIGPDGIIDEVLVGGPQSEVLLRSKVLDLLKDKGGD